MLIPIHHPNEDARLDALHQLEILDTAPEASYDNITHLASFITGCPISLISFIDLDRQWFKSEHGSDLKETSRTVSFCAHTILQNDILIIEDARKDERFADNPVVTGKSQVVFYAGVPLKDADGFPLGSLCVVDKVPHQLSPEQVDGLKKLAEQVMSLLKLRKRNIENKRLTCELTKYNRQLEHFALVLTHDLKSPLNNVLGALDLLELEIKEKVDTDDIEYLDRIKETVIYLREFTQNLLQYYKASEIKMEHMSEVDPFKMIERLRDAYTRDAKTTLTVHSTLEKIIINRVGLEQILSNLIDNAEKYAVNERVNIDIYLDKTENGYCIKVKDDGPGIPDNRVIDLFDLFTTTEQNRRSSGVGLATVKRIVEQLGGSIEVETDQGKGSTFIIDLPGQHSNDPNPTKSVEPREANRRSHRSSETCSC